MIDPFSIILNCAPNTPRFFVLRAIVPDFLATCSISLPNFGSMVFWGPLKRSFRKTRGALSSLCFSPPFCQVSRIKIDYIEKMLPKMLPL